MTSIQQVEEFHKVFNHVIAPEPVIPDNKNNEFRRDFLIEELDEIKRAILTGDLVEFADGLADLQYVLDGWFLNAGLQNHKDAIMEEVHRSNMSKVCQSWDEAMELIKSLPELDHGYEIDPVDKYFTVKRKSDGKVMKSKGYSKPDIARILNKQL